MAGFVPTPAHAALAATLRSLADIPEDELVAVLPLFHPQHVTAGGFLLHAGETPTTLAFLHAGLARLLYIDEAGNEFTKSFCAENGFLGAYSALLRREPSRLFIQALEDCELLVADYAAYTAHAADRLCWQTVNRLLAEALFIKKEQREASLLLDDATTRYQQFLAANPELAERVQLQHIASYLGITPVSLSRIRAQLRRLTIG